MLQRFDRVRGLHAARQWLLDRYFEGWAEANPAKILDAAAPAYRFHDPFVGTFSRRSLPRYFELLQARFARAGAVARHDLAFFLRGPMNGNTEKPEFWREAPRIGLTGVAQIDVGPRGIIAERVAYDLNLASDVLCRVAPTRASIHCATRTATIMPEH